MFTTQLIILTIFVLAIFYMVKFLQKKKVKVTQPVPPLLKTILKEVRNTKKLAQKQC